MKICRFCGKEISDDAIFCRYCGNKQEEIPKSENNSFNNASDEPEDGIVCPRCGTINSENAETCRNCGSALSFPQPTDEGLMSEPLASPQSRSMENEAADNVPFRNKKSKKWLWPALALASLFLLIIAGSLFAFTRLKSGEEGFDLSKAELLENYIKPTGNGAVDLTARDHQPAARNLAGRWNSQIFYWLEDIGGEDDNHIADCLLTRMELTRQDNGKILEYEVYRDPDTEEIYKIVSIETLENGSLELSDYYYQDGKPNFVFRRSDSVYTPSYASIDKVGERYYFADDQMVKWRWIYEPSVVKQWILELEDTWYTQWAYSDISDGERAEYDEKELQVLNEAYHTYEAVTANPQVTLIEGRVIDEAGNPLEGVEVGIGTIETTETEKTKNPEIKLLTDKDGRYAWAVDEVNARYFLVFQKEGWIQAIMEPSLIPEAFAQAPQDDLILLADRTETTSPITFLAYEIKPQDEDADEENAQNEASALADAAITVYAGLNYTAEAPVTEDKTDADGKLSLDLSPGLYTAEIKKEGFTTATQIFLADGSEKELTIYTMTEADDADGDVWSILLTWNSLGDSSLDLDSSLFTPDKAAMGDRNCVNTLNRSDGKGTRYLYDGRGKNAYEIITLTAPKKGSYKYYVSSYTDILDGVSSSDHMASSHAKVTLCRNGVPVKTFAIPDKRGTVWEVFELRNQQVIPIQEVYENVQGKNWWTEDKQMARISEDGIRADWIQSDGEWLYFANPADNNKLYYCRKDGNDLTKFCDDRLLNTHILLLDNQIYYIPSDGYGYIARINTDGSGRELLTGNMQLSEMEEYDENGDRSSLDIKGYKNGILYYYYAPETFGSIGGLSVTDLSHVSLGNFPQSIVFAGNSLYYVDNDYFGSDDYSFYRKKLSEEENICLQENNNWWYHGDWTIYKGWIYYSRGGSSEIRCIKPDGTGDMLLTANGAEWNNKIIVQNDFCYYIGNDRQIYRISINGGSPAALTPGNRLAILDGEIYTRDGSSQWSPIMVCDKDGSNRRQLLASGASRQANAMMAYAGFLDGYVPGFYSYEYGGDIKFACQDIDNDGVNELFVQTPSPARPNLFTSYFRYEDSIKQIWDGVEGGTVAVDISQGEFTIYYVSRNDYMDRYRVDGALLENLAFYPGEAPPPYSELELAAFEEAYNTYIKPYPRLNFVVNSPANRQQYLINGTGTGWSYQ